MGAIVCRGVTKRYGATVALDGVNLEVQPAAATALLGANGAGKSTLLRILLGLVHADAGEVRVMDSAPGQERPGAVVAVLEQPRFYAWMSGNAHVGLLGALRTQAPEDEAAVFERLQLSGAMARKVKGYSQGMRQRLALGLALLQQPSVLLLDEPTNGLDPEGIEDFRRLIAELAEAGTTILYSTHNVHEAELTCAHVVVIARGQVRAAGTRSEVCEGEPLEAAYFRLTRSSPEAR